MTHAIATPDLAQRLRSAGVQPTLQRVVVAGVVLERPRHLTAEQVLAESRLRMPEIARATVYATLRLFVARRLLKELVIDGVAAVYDSTLTPHHHLYDVDTGEVSDLDAAHVQVSGLPAFSDGTEIAEVDIVVRVRRMTTTVAR